MERKLEMLFRPCVYTLCALLIVGCKGVISSTDLAPNIATMAQPTFGGATSVNYTSPSRTSYTLNGECMASALSIEYSYNQSTWTDNGNCSGGTFSITPIAVSTARTVYVRAKGPNNVYSAISTARIRYAFPPTTPNFAFVGAGSADDNSMQFGLEHTMTQENMDNLSVPQVIIQPSIIGAAEYD